jgi:hypothetical protein
MNIVRIATPEEVEEIKATSDLQFAAQVFASGDMRAVYRLAPELDPVIYKDASMNEKRFFITCLEAHMRLSGVPAYYFNVPATEEFEKYRAIVEHWGAIPTAATPEIRYKKAL